MGIIKYLREKLGVVEKFRESNSLSLFVGHPLFQGFSRRERQKLWQIFDVLELEPGAKLIDQDEPCNSLHLLISGKITLTHRGKSGKTIRWHIEKPGQTIGEWSFIDSKPSLVRADVADRSSVIALKYGNLKRLLRSSPRLGSRFLLNMGRFVSFRLRQTNKKLTTKADE